MKRNVLLATILAVGIGVAAEESAALIKARAELGNLIQTPNKITAVVQGLSSSEQKQFVAEMNSAIEKMPGSVDEKAAAFLNANHAAVKGAQKGNVSALIAETFATVPPQALAAISESFAAKLINRAADPTTTYSDDQFASIAKNLMETINKRVAESDDSSARSVLAIVMLEGASNGSPANLGDMLAETLSNAEARELAKSEWLPAARDKENPQRFEPLLAATDQGLKPDYEFILKIAGPQNLDAVLSDLDGKNIDQQSFINTKTPIIDAVQNTLVAQIPQMETDQRANANPQAHIGADAPHDVEPGQKPNPEDWKKLEPGGYQWQLTSGGNR